MKTILIVLTLMLVPAVALVAQKTKKVQTFSETKVLPFSAEQVWAIVGEDYGKVADSHPRIISSDYINGELKGCEGAERVCNFNQAGTQYLHERISDWNPEAMSFTNTVFHAGKFPVDPAYTKAIYKVSPIDANSCEISFNMQYRTKPAIMGGFAKGKFRKLIRDYFIAIEHHLSTGEKVTRDNFKSIKKSLVSK